jgi:hypothetical protein
MERALAEASEADRFRKVGTPSPGDTNARMRNLPVIARGVAGAHPGTAPLGALLAKEARAARRSI